MTEPANNQGETQIKEILVLRRTIQRLSDQLEVAQDAWDKFAALCDQLNAQLQESESMNRDLSNVIASMSGQGSDGAAPPTEPAATQEG